MKFSVATNFQDSLIQKIKSKPVEELFGKLAKDLVGGGRASYLLPHISKIRIKEHIEKAHQNGIKFNYLLNGVCFDNREFTGQWQRRLHKLLEWIESIKADSLTIANPYLFQLIKKRYRKFRLYVSLFAYVDSIEKAKFWQDLGADKIILPTSINRDFKMLSALRKNIDCELQLIANQACLKECPIAFCHHNILSHSSQASHQMKGYVIDYCALTCHYIRMTKPMEIIRSGWIRPEDIHIYEDVGIDSLKLTDRCFGTETISSIVEAYSARRYDGNLLDLIPAFSEETGRELKKWRALKYFFRPLSINLFRARKLLRLRKINIGKLFIDNRDLDGFLEGFFKIDCRLISCKECGYCQQIAQAVVKFSDTDQKDFYFKHKRAYDELFSNKLFRYW